MRKKILFMLAGLMTMFASCQMSDDSEVHDKQCNTKITVSAKSLINSRNLVEKLNRYVMEVYVGDSPTGTPESHIEQSDNTFNLLLRDDLTYTILFWADNGTPNDRTGEYDVSDLKSVRIQKQPTMPAWSGSLPLDNTHLTNNEYQLELCHSVAQVNFIQSEDFTQDNNTLQVTFPKTYTLNVYDNSVTEIKNSEASVPAIYSFTTTSKEQTGEIIGTSYVIAHSVYDYTDKKILLNLTANLNNGESIHEIDNVPFACNLTTNITGAFSNLYINSTNVTIDDEWLNFPKPETADPDPEPGTGNTQQEVVLPRVGYYYYDDNTFSNEYNNRKTCLGIVFYIDPSDRSIGKIVSLTSTLASWSTEYNINDLDDDFDGDNNLEKIKSKCDLTSYPAFDFCNKLGDGWYLPAREELIALFEDYEVSYKFSEITGETLEMDYFWSSSEYDEKNAYVVAWGPDITEYDKNNECKVVAIRKYDL